MRLRKLSLAVGCLAAVLCAIEAGVALAEPITVDASTDVWIREKSGFTDTTYEGDGVSVYSNSTSWRGDGSTKRRGAIEFDLSGVTDEITGAYLKLYATSNELTNITAIVQTATSLHVHGTLGSMTWWNKATYTDPPAPAPVDFESFGYFDIASDQPVSQYYSSSNATAYDLTELNAMRTSSEKKLTLLLLNQSGSGFRDWGDASTGVAQLVLVTAAPEPSAIMLMATGLLGLLAYAWRKQK